MPWQLPHALSKALEGICATHSYLSSVAHVAYSKRGTHAQVMWIFSFLKRAEFQRMVQQFKLRLTALSENSLLVLHFLRQISHRSRLLSAWATMKHNYHSKCKPKEYSQGGWKASLPNWVMWKGNVSSRWVGNWSIPRSSTSKRSLENESILAINEEREKYT